MGHAGAARSEQMAGSTSCSGQLQAPVNSCKRLWVGGAPARARGWRGGCCRSASSCALPLIPAPGGPLKLHHHHHGTCLRAQLEEELGDDHRWCYRVSQVLHSGSSQWQEMDLVDTPTWGKVGMRWLATRSAQRARDATAASRRLPPCPSRRRSMTLARVSRARAWHGPNMHTLHCNQQRLHPRARAPASLRARRCCC